MKREAEVIGRDHYAQTVHENWQRIGGAIPVDHRRGRDLYAGIEGEVRGNRVLILGERLRSRIVPRGLFIQRFALIDESEYELAPLRKLTGGDGGGDILEEGSVIPWGQCICGRALPASLSPNARISSDVGVTPDYFRAHHLKFVTPPLAEAMRPFPGVKLTPVEGGRLFHLESDRHLIQNLLPRGEPCAQCGETSDLFMNLEVFAKPPGPISGMYDVGAHHAIFVHAPDLLELLMDSRWKTNNPHRPGLPVFLDTIPWDITWTCPDLLYATPDFAHFYAVPGLTEIPPGDAQVLLLGGVRMPADLEALAQYEISVAEAAKRALPERTENPDLCSRLVELGASTPNLDEALATEAGREAILKLADVLIAEFDARYGVST